MTPARCHDHGCDDDIFGIVEALVRRGVPPIRVDVYRTPDGRWMLLMAKKPCGTNPYHVVYCATRFGLETLPGVEWTGPQPPHCFTLEGLARATEIQARLRDFACVPIVRDTHAAQYDEAIARAQGTLAAGAGGKSTGAT